MARVSDLYALQEVDSEMDALQRTLDELRGMGEESEQVAADRLALEEIEAQRKAIESEHRQLGYEVEDAKAQTAAVETKLYSGEVSNSKELRDLQRELEALQRRQAEREEAFLAVMGRLEEASTHEAVLRRSVTEGAAAWKSQHDEADRRAAEIEADLERLRQRRAAAMRPVEAPALALYERLRRSRSGRAVARVERGTCLGCRIVLPSNLFQRARSGATVVQCSSCERILFVG